MSAFTYNISPIKSPYRSQPPVPYQFSAQKPPVQQPPVQRPPVQQPPVQRPLVYQPSVQQPSVQQPSAEKPKQKNKWTKVIIGVVIIVAIIIIVILIFVFVGGSSGGGGGGGGNNGGGNNLNPNSPNVPTPPDNAPNQDVTGSGGVCTVDTDCPLIFQTNNGQLQTYSQYCVSGICVTNKVCTTNADCQSVPDLPELDTCNLGGTGPAAPCRYTSGCGGGFCIRQGCKTTTDCGLNEACSLNDPLGTQTGVCLPIGNKCTNSTTGNSAQCWAGTFGCTAYSGVAQGQVSTGYCTECYNGNNNSCNLSNNPLGGPGAYCETVNGNWDLSPDVGAPPAVCKTNDSFKYFDCPSGTVAGSTLNGVTICCSSGSSVNTCGQKCLDDYQCGDNCPYCVPVNGDIKNRVCSCVKVAPTQDGANGVQAEYACVDGFGFTYDFNSGNKTANQINPNYHVCVANETAVCAFNYDAVDTYGIAGYPLVGARGNTVCSNLNNPYCELKTGTCKSTLEGSVCITHPDGSSPCVEITSDGTSVISTEYACTLNRLCTKRSYLIAGENCTPPTNGGGLSCGDGLICSLPMGPSNKRVCIPDGFGS